MSNSLISTARLIKKTCESHLNPNATNNMNIVKEGIQFCLLSKRKMHAIYDYLKIALLYCLPPFYSNIASVGRSIVDYNRSSFPWKPQ